MTVRDPFVLGSGNTDADNLVDKLIGNAYQVVKYVAINMRGLTVISDNMVKISAVYDNLAALQSIQQNLEMLNVVAENVVPLAALGAEIDKLLAIYDNLTAITNVSANMADVVAVADKLPELTLIATQLDSIIDTLDNLASTGGAGMVGTLDGITVQVALYNRFTKDDLTSVVDGETGATHIGYNRLGAPDVGTTVFLALRALEAFQAALPQDLASTTDVAKGPALVGFNEALAYAAGSLGAFVKTLDKAPRSSVLTPTTGAAAVGDRVRNPTPSITNPVIDRVCITAGTPGTWRATSWLTLVGTTPQRPVLTVNDMGVMYMDTTLTAAGKPIWWNGAVWVDATGVAV